MYIGMIYWITYWTGYPDSTRLDGRSSYKGFGKPVAQIHTICRRVLYMYVYTMYVTNMW